VKDRAQLAELSRVLDGSSQTSAELERRLDVDPQLARHARALRRVDALLRSELGNVSLRMERSIAPNVLSRLSKRRAGRRSERWITLAAAAAVLALAPMPRQPARTPPPLHLAPQNWTWAERWLQHAPVAPEQTLVVEARRLADDTRLVARSLWSSLPLGTWLHPPAWIFGERR
jgi:hypothetical protein